MALLLGLAMLPAGAIAMQVGLNAVGAHQAAQEEALSRRALEAVSAARVEVDGVREMLRAMASTPQVRQLSGARCGEWLNSVVERYPDLASISITNDAGVIRCSAPAAPPDYQPRPSSVRERARERGGFAVGYVERGALTQRPVLGAAEVLRDDGGQRVGFISASVELARLSEAVERGRAMDGARVAVVDYAGNVLAEALRAAEAPPLPIPSEVRAHLGGEPSFIDVRGGAAVVAPLSAPDLYLLMTWAPDQPLWRRNMALILSVAAPLLIWLLAIGAGWFAIEIYVARPLSNLEAAARGFARGEDVEEAPLATAPDEIRTLRRTLAAMAKTLRGRELRLIEALAEERALLREVHHRVKNNLQMVASLLNIQARGASDESEAWGLARAHDRVQLLALVHQRIYASGEVRELRIDELAADIARQLLQSRGMASSIRLNFDFGEVRADADRAVPLAFLIGEGIAAALDGLDGHSAGASLALRQDEDGAVRFTITCDQTIAVEPTGPSGRLIDAFARQLGARVGRSSQHPLDLWVAIPPPPAA